MSADYDTFSYDDQKDQIYEPILDNDLPPVPPRNPRLPPAPTRKQPPVPVSAPPQAPNENYEDLNRIPQHMIPDTPPRLPPPVPDVSQRMPPPVPNHLQRPPMPALDAGPEMNYEDLNDYDDQGPEMNYEDLSGYDDQQELNYEDLNYDQDVPLPPPPPPVIDLKQRTLPPVPDQPQKKPNFPMILDNNFLNAALKKLKKTDMRPPVNSPKPQTETPVKILSSSINCPSANKPILPEKPKFISAKSSSIHERISALNIDSPDSRKPPVFQGNNFASKNNTLPPTAKVSPSNNFASKNNTLPTPAKASPSNNFASKNITPPPVKLSPSCGSLTSKNSEDFSDEDFDSGEEYADAADVKSLQYQSYYYKSLSKEMEGKIFHSNTQDGTFVIRQSRTKSIHPYTMLVFYKTRIYRLKIRYEDDEYAIGEKKVGENRFSCVIKLVEYFMTVPLLLIDAGSVKLRLPPDNI